MAVACFNAFWRLSVADWKVDESSDVLRAMRAVEDMIVVGLYSGDRMEEYTKPGYEKYALSLRDEIVPTVDERLRTGRHRRYRSVWGSSLGGHLSLRFAALTPWEAAAPRAAVAWAAWRW